MDDAFSETELFKLQVDDALSETELFKLQVDDAFIETELFKLQVDDTFIETELFKLQVDDAFSERELLRLIKRVDLLCTLNKKCQRKFQDLCLQGELVQAEGNSLEDCVVGLRNFTKDSTFKLQVIRFVFLFGDYTGKGK